MNNQLLTFLKEDLEIPAQSLNLALNHPDLAHGSLPMLLWRYGLISLDQLGQIFDWLEGNMI